MGANRKSIAVDRGLCCWCSRSPELLAFFFLDCFCCCCQRQSALVWPAWPGTEHSACGLVEAEALCVSFPQRAVSTADLPPPLRLKALRVDTPSLGLPMTRAMCADWKTGPIEVWVVQREWLMQ